MRLDTPGLVTGSRHSSLVVSVTLAFTFLASWSGMSDRKMQARGSGSDLDILCSGERKLLSLAALLSGKMASGRGNRGMVGGQKVLLNLCARCWAICRFWRLSSPTGTEVAWYRRMSAACNTG